MKQRIRNRRKDGIRQRYWVGGKILGSFGSKKVIDGKIPYRIEYSENDDWKPAFEGHVKPKDLDSTFNLVAKKSILLKPEV